MAHVCVGLTLERAGHFLKQAPACVRGRVEARTCFGKASLQECLPGEKHKGGNYLFDSLLVIPDGYLLGIMGKKKKKKCNACPSEHFTFQKEKTHCPF
jgi:hypothetical protein